MIQFLSSPIPKNLLLNRNPHSSEHNSMDLTDNINSIVLTSNSSPKTENYINEEGILIKQPTADDVDALCLNCGEYIPLLLIDHHSLNC